MLQQIPKRKCSYHLQIKKRNLQLVHEHAIDGMHGVDVLVNNVDISYPFISRKSEAFDDIKRQFNKKSTRSSTSDLLLSLCRVTSQVEYNVKFHFSSKTTLAKIRELDFVCCISISIGVSIRFSVFESKTRRVFLSRHS